jgi:hypothetical protein
MNRAIANALQFVKSSLTVGATAAALQYFTDYRALGRTVARGAAASPLHSAPLYGEMGAEAT